MPSRSFPVSPLTEPVASEISTTPLTGPLTAVLKGGPSGPDKVTYDAWIVDAAGHTVASMQGVTHHRLPGTARG